MVGGRGVVGSWSMVGSGLVIGRSRSVVRGWMGHDGVVNGGDNRVMDGNRVVDGGDGMVDGWEGVHGVVWVDTVGGSHGKAGKKVGDGKLQKGRGQSK